MKWPDVYEFGAPVGPVHKWFAWRPVRLWWGKWVWLRTVQRSRVVKYIDLTGPHSEWWTYEEAAE